MLKKNYFWLASYPLQPGSVVDAGNWGRIIRTYKFNSQSAPPVGMREYIFEYIRMKFFSDKPSRLESIFLCESKEQAVNFQRHTSRDFDLLFEVQITDETKPIGIFDYRLTDFPIDRTISIAQFEENARKYWQGEITPNGSKEILTTSPIKVIKRL